ncbi:MAG: ABC transporter ATP-binding protein [Betaproteobacteria bacterium]|nr:MAG: ABC transporter ATP-binding protein [Betaproteobacteria bacterium]
MPQLLDVSGLTIEVRVRGQVFPVVRNVDLSVAAGESLCIVGESGCGKSMTALGIMRLLPRGASRTVLRLGFDGVDIAHLSQGAMEELRGQRMSMIFQDPNTAFNPSYTIGDQLQEVWLRHKGGGRDAARARAVELLERVGIASAARRLGQYPHQLSGGQRQRAMIAMALMCSPQLLIADEPTTALDVTVQAQVLRLLRELQSELGLALLLITHDIGVVAAMADRVAVLYAGEVVETGPVRHVLDSPCHPYTKGLLDCLPRPGAAARRLVTIPGTVPVPTDSRSGCGFAGRCALMVDDCQVGAVALEAIDGERVVRCRRWRLMSELPLSTCMESAPARSSKEMGQPILFTDGVTRDFRLSGGLFSAPHFLRAVRGVSLRMRAGETVAIVGESGCGKTTLARILLGLLDQSTGDVRLDGRPIAALARRAVARFVQPVFQDPYASLAPHRRVVDTVARPLDALAVGTRSARRRTALDTLARVGLPSHLAGRLPAELSGGQCQRVAIARALVLKPPILVCDEPTSSLDVSVQAQILNLLSDLKDEFGLCVLLITHNLAVVEHLADRVVVMYLGRIVEEGPVDEVLRRPRHPYTRLLLSSVLRPDIRGGGLAVVDRDESFPDPLNPPPGCAFHPRCPKASAVCRSQDPATRTVSPVSFACHHPDHVAPADRTAEREEKRNVRAL